MAMDKLKDICKNYLLEEKILIVPSYSAGKQIKKMLADEGCPVINLRTVTLGDLALDMAIDKTVIKRTASSHIVYSILKRMAGQNRLKYLKKINIVPGIGKIICNGILELKHSGTRGLGEEDLVDKNKARDLQAVFEEYEKCLSDEGLADEADIFRVDRDSLVFTDIKYMIFSNHRLGFLQEKFLKEISQDKLIVLDMPVSSDIAKVLRSDLKKMEISKAYGEGNEVKSVIRDIKRRGVSFDSCVVYVSTMEPYCQLFYNLAQKDKLSFSFSNGISASNTRPFKFIKIILKLMESNFRISDLLLLIENNILKCENSNDLVYNLRKARIGWGKSRYFIKQGNLTFIQGFIKDIPEKGNENISLKGLLKILQNKLNKYCRISGDLDAEAINSLNDIFDSLSGAPDISCSISEAIKIIRSVLEDSRVGASPPGPGCIHIADYRSDLWTNRENNYAIGLDSQKFPGQAKEDPVLLNIEKDKLGIDNYNRNIPNENIKDMVLLLSLLRGYLHISYSSFDISENREIAPSALMLDLYRIKENNFRVDYTEMGKSIKLRSGFIPSLQEEIIDGSDWWLYNILKENKTENIKEVLENSFRFYADGAKAFDQWHRRIDAEDLDPRKNKGPVSCSQLELMAKCPFAYYIKYILGIYPPDHLTYKEGEWLNALEKGKAYHIIFHKFYEKLSEKKEKPNSIKHINIIYEIAEAVLKEMKELIPPPEENVFDHERKLFLDSCRVFVKCEEEHAGESDPAYFEYSFGIKDSVHPEPVKIEMPSGDTFYLHGKIDRIDKTKDDKYRIIDYKTGSCYDYSGNKVFKKGNQLQHALYSIAFEFIHKGIEVKEGGYIFPTIKGEGRRYIYALDKQTLYNILTDLFDIISKGFFPMMHDKNICEFCDYVSVCRSKRFENTKGPGPDTIRRLENYV